MNTQPPEWAMEAANEIQVTTCWNGPHSVRIHASRELAAIISKHFPQRPLPVSETPRDGNWMDAFGACKVCKGEIPHGHANNCDIYKLEMDVATERAARESLAKALNAYPDSNLVSLATTLEAIRRKAEVVFPLVEKLREALVEAPKQATCCCDFGYAEYHQHRAYCSKYRVNKVCAAALASVPAEKGQQ